MQSLQSSFCVGMEQTWKKNNNTKTNKTKQPTYFKPWKVPDLWMVEENTS